MDTWMEEARARRSNTSWGESLSHFEKFIKGTITYDMYTVAKLVQEADFLSESRPDSDIDDIFAQPRTMFRDTLMEAGLVDEDVLCQLMGHSAFMAKKVIGKYEESQKEKLRQERSEKEHQ